MSLYEMLGETAQLNTAGEQKPGGKIMGPMVGIVAKRYSKDMPGRVCVQIPVRDKDANTLKWAKTVMPSAGKKWGSYFLPEIGDKVLLLFEDGNIEKPYIVGSIFSDDSQLLSKTADEDNRYKRITTRNGNTVLFEDNKDGDGDKDKIKIATAKEEQIILLDNENKRLSVKDKKGENSIEIDIDGGAINVKAKKELKINVGSVKVTIDGENGKVSVSCDNLSVKANGSIKLEADGMVKLKGENASISGNSSAKLTSDGTTVIKGSMIKEG